MATTNVANESAKLLRAQAKDLRGFATACSNEADNLRALAATKDASATEANNRAAEYEASANTLNGA